MSSAPDLRSDNLSPRRIASVRTTVFDRFASSPSGRVVGMLLLTAALLFLAAYPLSMLLYGSMFTAQPGLSGTFDLGGYARLFTAHNIAILGNTVQIALVSTGVSITLAVLLAWILARTDTPFRGPLEVLITLPFFIPPFLTAMAWGMLGNPQIGVINMVWRWITGTDGTIINVYSYFDII